MSALVAREILEAVRSRWFLAVTAVFGLLAAGVSYMSTGGADALGFAGFNRTVAGLLNLVLLFLPLMGLLIGALGISGEKEDGTLGYLLAQPVGRVRVYLYKFAGQWLSLILSIGFGLGIAGLVVGGTAGAGGLSGYGTLVADAALLAAASLGIGILAGVIAATRLRALTAALLLWILFAFVIDFAAIGLVVSGRLGAAGVFLLSLASPVQIAKVLCLLAMSARLEVLGPAGIYAVKTFGHGGALALLGAGLALWTILPAAAGLWLFRRLNVR